MRKFLINTAFALGISLIPVFGTASFARTHTGVETTGTPSVKSVVKKKIPVKSSKRNAKRHTVKKNTVKKNTVKKNTVKKKTVKKNTAARSARTVVRTIAPAPKCQFLFWEVECANNRNDIDNMSPSNYEPRRLVATSQNITSDYEPRRPIATTSKNIARAQKYVGLHARKNRQTVKAIISKPFDRPIDPVRIPWCAAFANAILRENNMATTDSLMARSFLNYGLVAKRPEEGDIVVLTRGRSNITGHVGFYVNTVTRNGKKYVAVLGGNQSKAINIAYYPATRVLGYRRPVAG
jgi:uncharacterized protein (TIGR02594 family)